MLEITFYDTVEDACVHFVVIAAKYQGKWVFCKHRERDTLECPGGHREPGESVSDAAGRELYEETGAASFRMQQLSIYSVTGKTKLNTTGEESFGALFYADIEALESELHNEIEYIVLLDQVPDNLTYPEIQPKLMEKVSQCLSAEKQKG